VAVAEALFTTTGVHNGRFTAWAHKSGWARKGA
jgi:hypothetical protein